MNILYHHRTQGCGAEGVHIREIVKALRVLGHTVDIVSPPGVDPFKNEIKAGSPKRSLKKRMILALPQIIFEFFEIGYNFFSYFKLQKQLRVKTYDLIYERYAFFCLAGILWAKKLKIPLILEVNEISGIKRQRPQTMVRLCRFFEKKIFSSVDALIVVSEFLKERLVERGIPGNKIFVIPNAVNIDEFNVALDGASVRKRYQLEDKLIYTFVGMFSHWDQLDFLLKAFKEVRSRFDKAHLMIVGEGTQRLLLEEAAAELGIRGCVTFAGEINRREIPQYIAGSDVCLLSGSNPFGSPIALFEYMVMAKPVVVPKYGPIESIVEHRKSGILFEPLNEQDFVEALFGLAMNQEERELLGKNARTKILNGHLWIHNAEAILKIYEGVNGNSYVLSGRS